MLDIPSLGPFFYGDVFDGNSQMISRFDNLSLDELIAREREQRAESDIVAEALKARLLAECPLRNGMIYRFVPDALWGQTDFLVCSLRPDSYWLGGGERYFYLGVHGFRPTKRSTAGDGFGLRPSVVRDWRLFDLSSAREGPRKYKLGAL